MMVEFTTHDAGFVLVNSDKVSVVQEETARSRACVILEGGDIRINVCENFQEIKKRLGLSIAPRGETLALR